MGACGPFLPLQPAFLRAVLGFFRKRMGIFILLASFRTWRLRPIRKLRLPLPRGLRYSFEPERGRILDVELRVKPVKGLHA